MEKVYMCGPFEKKEELRKWGEFLTEKCDIEVVSRWLNGSHDGDGDVTEPLLLRRFAYEDLEDIEKCDVVVAMAGHGGVSGGRHWECGYAMAKGKRIIIVGQRENAFQYTCDYCRTIEDAAVAITTSTMF